MSGKYQSKHLQNLFDVSSQTIRTWADEFQEYMSPSASPEPGRHRQFTEEDLRVFALIKELKGQGKLYEDIHASLKAGSRGDLPTLPPDDMVDIVATQQGLALLQQFQSLIQRVETLDSEVKSMRESLKAERVQELKEELEKARSDKMEMMRKIGRLEALLEIEREKNAQPDSDE
jgi:DNA-binding transcriptional MerR regulator